MIWMWVGIAIVALGAPAGAAPPLGTADQVRMFGRGARAWENFDDGLGQMHPEVSRLPTHAVADATGGATYLPYAVKVLER